MIETDARRWAPATTVGAVLGGGEVAALVALGVAGAAALCWVSVTVAVRRARRGGDRRDRAARRHV